jgi:Kef-type K+ transport system membrane component KefB
VLSTELLSLLSLFCIVVLPYAIWRFGHVKCLVPCVVVQIILGIAVGHSGLGAIAPALEELILPAAIRDQISSISAFAILLFVFVTGLHIDLAHYSDRLSAFVLVGFGSILLPFCLGAAAASWIYRVYPIEAQSIGGEVGFVAAVAIAVSVTALPVLGMILRELNLSHLPIGQWSLGLAAINDSVLWFLVSAVFASVGRGEAFPFASLLTLLYGGLYLALMIGFVKPLLFHFFQKPHWQENSDSLLVTVTGLAIISASVTEIIGLHYLLGAFIAGSILPGMVRKTILDQIEHTMVLLLAPFFFIATGLKVNLDFSSHSFVEIFLVTTAAAVIGKFVGVVGPTRCMGFSWRESLALGSVMQAKGMMELAVLTILLDAGLISKAVFSALTLMALVTTALAMPLTRFSLWSTSLARRTECQVHQ